MKKLLEICCDSIQSALNAEAGGADRIELCENLAQGGVTPSAGKIRLTKKLLHIPVFVLIRPRKADFLYSALELELMLEDIRVAKELGADGIVAGALHPDGTIDGLRTRRLIEAAFPLPFTFHRALDMCRDPLVAMETLIELGARRVLTSGKSVAAPQGEELIRQLVEKAGRDITVMAGGGITPSSIDPLLHISGLKEFHASARHLVYSQMQYFGEATMGLEGVQEEFRWHEVDRDIVKELKNKIKG
jgi:copper homeostasis protein